MFNFIKNKFAFIIAISALTLIMLVAGAVILYQDNSKVFENEGYIISSTAKKNAKYYFSANTKYKENVDSDIVFKDSDSKSVTVSAENFVHYQNGSIGFLTNGALLNLNEINSSALNYYNVRNDDIITYKNKNYVVKSNKGEVNIESLIGRISDNKYIVAGKNVTLKVPNKTEKISGNYFEILFIENGIVKIDNQEVSYQVTAQDTTITVDNDIIIDLGSGKISYNGEAKMLMSQLTINGDENIEIDTVDKKDDNSESGTGSNTGEENGEGGTGTGDGTNTENGEDQNGENGETGENGEGGNGTGNGKVEATAQIELIEATVTSTAIDLSFQLNNASAIKGTLTASLTNVGNNNKEIGKVIEARNGTFTLSKESLLPDTEYTLTITETNKNSEKQYFQKTFKTNELGITLEKEYATSNSLAYSIQFNENSDVEKAKLVIFDSNGEKNPTSYTIGTKDISKTVEFAGLLSNSSYSVKVESIWIRNIEYSDVYTINRIDTTLKQTPVISDIKITTEADDARFRIKANQISDPDKAIVSYKYYIYKAEDINLDNPNPTPVYIVNKNDNDELVLDLNEIEELKTGVDYRCKVIALYDDNTMVREAASDYSVNFLIKAKPNISWTTTSSSINRVSGTLKLLDGNCSVPVNGRRCLNRSNTFIARYYKLGEDESTGIATQKTITFSADTLTADLTFDGLSSNTTFALKLYGNYYDDDNQLHSNVQIGEVVYFKTDVSENLKFKVINDNTSGAGSADFNLAPVVTFDAKLEAPEDSTLSDEISSITFNLYSGSYNVENKLIGTYVMDDKVDIKDFFSRYTITNKLFTNEDLGLINTVDKLIRLTNNQTGTLNGTYTVEIVDVMDSAGVNEIYVEDNIYTFKLTPKYYLDARIGTTNVSYINVTSITKKQLTEEEHDELIDRVPNLDDLNDDTVVGIIIESTLPDSFVDSSFTYEKVVLDYVVYNLTTKKEAKRVSIDMGNKYQPKSQIIYLDPTEYDDGENFTRGYNYKISYELNFTTEKGDNPVYTNAKMQIPQIDGQTPYIIKRQSAIYNQYISTSTSENITYRYKITDIDNSLQDKYLYFSYKNSDEKVKSSEEMVADGNFHDLVLPINENREYSVYLKEKGTGGTDTYKEITKNTFEGEYIYDNQNAFQIVNDNDNTLKIKILENDITKRAAAFKLTVKDKSGNLPDFTRFFLNSKLLEESYETGETDEGGNPLTAKNRYITLDYAQISDYMKHDLEVSIDSYFNSGLVGINQQFTNGMIITNGTNYLNIYNAPGVANTSQVDNELMGVYRLAREFPVDGEKIAIFNNLKATNKYDMLSGSELYETDSTMGVEFDITYTNAGIIFKSVGKEYSGYNTKVVKTATLKSNNYNYRFESIVPKVSITNNNTINSLKIKVNSTGVYGQFKKNNQEHNIFYIDIYSSSDLSQESHIQTLQSNITITNNTAESETVELKNLTPDTTYYVTVSAYLEGTLTRLYDMNSKNGYVYKTYESKTLGGSEILSSYDFKVRPVAYDGEASKKRLRWSIRFANKNGQVIPESQENLKIRFELYDQEGNAIKFDGTEGTGCDSSVLGQENNNYIANCYIQIPKEKLASVHSQTIDYFFSNNSFIFDDGAYKLIIYAIPYTNGQYKEEDKVIISQLDRLITRSGGNDELTHITYNTDVYKLKQPEVGIKNLESGTRCVTEKDSEGNTIYNGNNPVCDSSAPVDKVEYYIEFNPDIKDTNNEEIIDNDRPENRYSYAIKYGTYTIKLRDSKNEVVSTKTNVNAAAVDKKITFSGLDANALYYVELSYETYLNNYGYTEQQKIATTPFTDFIYTPIDAGITLGTITATQNNNQRITLTYNGAYNMTNNIKKVSYTISLKGGSSNASGSYEIGGDILNIFTMSTDKTPKLSIDLSESSDENFTLKSGNTYIITTQYWYKNEFDEYVLIKDHNTQNDKFTTILNL